MNIYLSFWQFIQSFKDTFDGNNVCFRYKTGVSKLKLIEQEKLSSLAILWDESGTVSKLDFHDTVW